MAITNGYDDLETLQAETGIVPTKAMRETYLAMRDSMAFDQDLGGLVPTITHQTPEAGDPEDLQFEDVTFHGFRVFDRSMVLINHAGWVRHGSARWRAWDKSAELELGGFAEHNEDHEDYPMSRRLSRLTGDKTDVRWDWDGLASLRWSMGAEQEAVQKRLLAIAKARVPAWATLREDVAV